MLKIILDTFGDTAKKYLREHKKNLVLDVDGYFRIKKKMQWFNEHDPLIDGILRDIDQAEYRDYGLKSLRGDFGYSVDDISGGAKFLILTYKRPQEMFLCTMGGNCTNYLEQIAKIYEKNGMDLVVISDTLHRFKLKYIDSIEYLNYNRVVHTEDEIDEDIASLWLDELDKYRDEDD